jgi:hypothetical protein
MVRTGSNEAEQNKFSKPAARKGVCLKSWVSVKEISVIKKRSSILHWDKRKDAFQISQVAMRYLWSPC